MIFFFFMRRYWHFKISDICCQVNFRKIMAVYTARSVRAFPSVLQELMEKLRGTRKNLKEMEKDVVAAISAMEWYKIPLSEMIEITNSFSFFTNSF